MGGCPRPLTRERNRAVRAWDSSMHPPHRSGGERQVLRWQMDMNEGEISILQREAVPHIQELKRCWMEWSGSRAAEKPQVQQCLVDLSHLQLHQPEAEASLTKLWRVWNHCCIPAPSRRQWSPRRAASLIAGAVCLAAG